MVIRTERGWAGHYCCAHKCLFKRNTLLTKDDTNIVVSTVGCKYYKEGVIQTIGEFHYYETMVFYANDTEYRDADISKQLDQYIDTLNELNDVKANDMHENMVCVITNALKKGEI